MILHWMQLPLHYGGQVAVHRSHFEEAAQTTYALLCCRFARGNDRLATSGGEHAERRLLESNLWREDIPAALENWSPRDRGRIVVTMVINRSPCPACSDALQQALQTLQWQHALSFQHARFLLASRGAYQGKVTAAGYYQNATTMGNLRRLHSAGWELCVLQMGNDLAPSGQALCQALERVTGRRAGPVRLEQ